MVIGKDIQPGSGNDTKNQGESAALQEPSVCAFRGL